LTTKSLDSSRILDSPEPQLIGGIFGRSPSVIQSSFLGKLQPKPLISLMALAGLLAFLALAGLDGALEGKSGVPAAVALLIHPAKSPTQVGLLLLQDPVGLVVLVMVLATPVFCVHQVAYIAGFVAMNEDNISYRMAKLPIDSINTETAKANRQYERVGSRTMSIGMVLFSAIASFGLDVIIGKLGLLASWNTSSLQRKVWAKEVYAGWWANPVHHFALAFALWLLGIYFFYFLDKQLAMGFIFARYVRSILQFDFGVTPNMRHNTDGYWGLRPLRYFMQWTYCSTLGHFIVTLGVFLVWLPFNQWTALVEVAVMCINFIVVIYPSILALRGSVREKMLFVKQVIASKRPRSEQNLTIDNVWATPNLPFHIRSTLTASTLYLLVPLLLALVSSLLTR
jgi:hypothetical protein